MPRKKKPSSKAAPKSTKKPSRYNRRSGFEVRISKELDDAGCKYTYETYSYEYDEALRKNQARCLDCGSKDLVRTGWYTPDFFLSNGTIIETKGRFSAADRRKMLAVEEEHKLGIKMLFMRDNRLSRQSKTFYSDWCMANGYDFAIGHVPKEWMK